MLNIKLTKKYSQSNLLFTLLLGVISFENCEKFFKVDDRFFFSVFSFLFCHFLLMSVFNFSTQTLLSINCTKRSDVTNVNSLTILLFFSFHFKHTNIYIHTHRHTNSTSIVCLFVCKLLFFLPKKQNQN